MKNKTMNKNLILICLVYFFCACNNNSTDKSHSDNDTIEAPVLYVWEAVDSNGKLNMKRTEEDDLDTLSPAAVVAYLNRSDSNVQLDLVKVSGDTVYLKIPDATYLTQQAGSAGAKMIMAEEVYNLTEIPGINYVNFDFKEGDHAAPGTYNRDSFEHY
jgi:hypothetical protein